MKNHKEFLFSRGKPNNNSEKKSNWKRDVFWFFPSFLTSAIRALEKLHKDLSHLHVVHSYL